MSTTVRQWLKGSWYGTKSKKNRPLAKARHLFEQLEPRMLLSFTHPGGLLTLTDLNRMKTEVAANAHPWIDDWNVLIADPLASSTYTNHATANMGTSRQLADQDAHAAYLNAIRWYISGDTSYANRAVTILNAWSAAVNVVPTGTDTPGLIGIPIFDFALAGEVLRIYSGWDTTHFTQFTTMMTTYLYPVVNDFLTNHNGAAIDHYWSNWDACNIGAKVAMGVLCDNQTIYNEGITYYETGAGNGSIMHAVNPMYNSGALGQEQESGRDQEHAQLAVGLLASVCQVAWNQGLDLYAYASNRLLAGAEYVAQTNLSKTVPYTYYTNSDQANQCYISINGIGRLDDRPIWEMIYNHYVVLQGLSAPNVQAMAQLMRPEHGSSDHFGYGTLTFTLSAAASPYPPSSIAPVPTGLTATAGVGQVMLQWNSSGDTAQGYTVQRATTSGGPYTTIASWTANTTPQYTDTDVTNGTTYYYVVAANNQSGTSANSTQASARPVVSGALPSGWAQQNIDTSNSAGSASFASVSNGTFVLGGYGTSIGGTADSFSYAYKSVTGNYTLIGRLLIDTSGTSNKVGLMMRDSLNANSMAVAVTLGETGGRETKFRTRLSNGANMTAQTGNDYTWMPVWYKLQRSGNTFTAYQSLDGVTWYIVGSSTTVSMANTYYVGLVACGSTTATFDNVTGAPSTPSDLMITQGDAQIALSWTPLADATSYNVKRATVSGGPYTTAGSGVTANNFTDTGLTNGTTYYYAVSAVVAGVETANSAEISTTPGMNLKFTGTIIGSSGSWGNNSATTKEAAMDGRLTTFYDALHSSGDWVGLDLGTTRAITQVKYCPRSNYASRMVGGQFQGSNVADFSSGVVTLFTISATPTYGVLTAQAISNTTPFRYVRYLGPTSGSCNVAEVEFYGNILFATIAGRYIFYNNSKFDSTADSAAIATDKAALLPGQKATFANYTSYSLGINGIIVDIKGLANPGALDAADFQFKVGNGGSWTAAPTPLSVGVSQGTGTNGSDRVTIIWTDDNAIKDKWLQITVLADADTGLGSADVFYFGNAIGESDDNSANAVVDSQDEIGSRTHKTGFSAAAIDNHYDYNRDGKVNATDDLIARHNRTDGVGADPLQLITAPASSSSASGDALQTLSVVVDETSQPATLSEDKETSQPVTLSAEIATSQSVSSLEDNATSLSASAVEESTTSQLVTSSEDKETSQPVTLSSKITTSRLEILPAAAEIAPASTASAPVRAALDNQVSQASLGGEDLNVPAVVKFSSSEGSTVRDSSLAILSDGIQVLSISLGPAAPLQSITLRPTTGEGLASPFPRRSYESHNYPGSAQYRLHDAVFARSIARFSLTEEDFLPEDSSAPADIDTILNGCPSLNSDKSLRHAIDNAFAALRHKKE